MKLIKKIFSIFSALEVIILMVAITVSTFIIMPVFAPSETSEEPVSARNLFPSARAYNTEGKRVDIFDTIFYVRYIQESDTILNEIVNVLNDYLVPYHKLFDRHNDYFAVLPVNESAPTYDEKQTLPRLHNLKYVNDHIGQEVEIAKPLYDLLSVGLDYTLHTPNNAFNMFIGELYDFWSPHLDIDYDTSEDPLYNPERKTLLEELVTYIPLTEEEIENTLKLRSEGNKYYVTFNEFNNSGSKLSISVGAIAKGMMTDILNDALVYRGLTKGFINGGRSSISFLSDGFAGKPLEITLGDIGAGADYAFKFTRNGKYQMSTSGIYEGSYFDYEGETIIRSHIINPLTGYPAQRNHHVVNLASDTLSGLELDYLSTSLIVLPEQDGLEFLTTKYGQHDINVVYGGYEEEGWYISYNANYPGGNAPSMIVNSQYREKFLDLL
jgi:thiamine biosynthesis lipoprotein ApbE